MGPVGRGQGGAVKRNCGGSAQRKPPFRLTDATRPSDEAQMRGRLRTVWDGEPEAPNNKWHARASALR